MGFLENFELVLWHSWGLWEMEMNRYITVNLSRTYWMPLQFQASFFLALAFVFGKLLIASGQLLTKENWVFDSFSPFLCVCMCFWFFHGLYFSTSTKSSHPPGLLGSVPVSYLKSLFFLHSLQWNQHNRIIIHISQFNFFEWEPQCPSPFTFASAIHASVPMFLDRWLALSIMEVPWHVT